MKDPLEFSEDELNSLSTEELKELYHLAQMKEDEYHTAQLCKKVTINSLYGALGNAFFPLFNQEIAQAITGNGRFYIQHTADLIEETLSKKLPSDKKYIVYGDTDSCAYDTLIKTSMGDFYIGKLYDLINSDVEITENGSEIKRVKEEILTSSVSEDLEIQNKRIVYIMKHTVKKNMWVVKARDESVVITEDHSLMIVRDGTLQEIKPYNVKLTDSLLQIAEDGSLKYSCVYDIKYLGLREETVYDIEVEDNHNFFGNNILLHNSVYFQIKPYVDLFASKNPNCTLKDKIDFCKKFMQKIIQPIIDRSNDLAYHKLNGFNRERIQAKNEVICDSAVLCAKKKYYARVRVDEGTEFPLDNPHIKVMGLELAKSTTPKWVKDKLQEAIPMIFDSTPDEIRKWVQKLKTEYTHAPLADIAMVGSASSLNYTLGEKGVPFGSRVAIVYNNYIKENNLENKYPLITESTKHQRMFLRTPNKFKTECIGYISDEFAEKNLKDIIDYDTQFKKSFLASLQLMVDCLGIDVVNNTESLDEW